MKKSKQRILYLCIAITVYVIGGITAIEVVDPAFLPNLLYRIIFFRISAVFSLLLTVYIIFIAFKRYKTDPSYQNTLQDQFHNFNFKGKCKLLLTLLFSPFLIAMMLWLLSFPAIELYGHYYYAKPWTEDYYLLKVEKCRPGYGDDCSSIKLKGLNSGFRPTFRWYEDKAALTQLKTQRITLRGYEGLFGRTAEDIQL